MKQIFLIIILLFFSAHSIFGQTKKVVREKQAPAATNPVNKQQSTRRVTWWVYYSFSEDLALAMTRDEKYGFVDKTGRIVISPRPWKNAMPFSEGLALVRDNKYNLHIINTKGEIVK